MPPAAGVPLPGMSRPGLAPWQAALALATVLAGLVAGAAAWAQPVLVRSGEHPGFSRLAMVLTPPRPWTLAGQGTTHVLQIDGVSEFDLSRVFALIPRDRLRDLVALPDGGGLRLDLACDCDLRAFEDRPGILVIDIMDRTDPAASGPGARPAPRPFDPVDTGAPEPSLQGETAADPAPGGALGAWLAAGLGPVAAPPDAAFAASDPAPQDGLAGAREDLARQIARAVSQNLVAITVPQVDPPDRPEGARAGPVAMPPEPAEGAVGLTIATAADRDRRDAAGRRTADGVACIAHERLDIASWGEGADGWTTITLQRGALLGEFDTPVPGAVQNLARSYLHLGLGAEAGALLRAFPGVAEDEALLALLAGLVDGGNAPGSALAGMAACGGLAAIWALLARTDLPERAELDRAGLLLAFAALPPGLRRLFGPRLSERFLDAGEAATAMTLRDSILRTPDGGGPATALLDARLALESGVPEVARDLLVPLANSGRAEAPEAAILLVEAMRAGGSPVPDALRETLAALAFEHRGSGLGLRLEGALAEAEAAAGQFAAAFARNDRIARELPPATAAALEMRLLGVLAETGPDDAFLRHALPAVVWRGGKAPGTLRQTFAGRFLDLGLPEAAMAALTPGQHAPEAERILHAQALLASGNAHAAMPLLSGLSGHSAATLRAQALESLGNPAAAAAALEAEGLSEAASALAWRSGDARLIALYGTPEQIAVTVAWPQDAGGQDAPATPAATGPAEGGAELPGPAGAPPPTPAAAEASMPENLPQPAPDALTAPSLAHARGLLAAGEGLRSGIAELLRAHPEP